MSTKPGIPDHFSIHDVRDEAAGSPPAPPVDVLRGSRFAPEIERHGHSQAFVGYFPGSPCAVCRLVEDVGGATAPPNVRPLCGQHFALFESRLPEMMPPVRDIREAMHPADAYMDRAFKNVPAIEAILDADPAPTVEEATAKIAAVLDADGIPHDRAHEAALRMASLAATEERPVSGLGTVRAVATDGDLVPITLIRLWTPGAPVEQVETRDVRRSFIPIANVPPDVLADIDRAKAPAAAKGYACPITLEWGPGETMAVTPGASARLNGRHVATLPDGSRVNLPAGTTLRAGEGQPMPVRFFDLANSLRAAFARVDEAMRFGDHVEEARAAWEALKSEMVAQEKINAPVRVVAPPSTIEQARDLLQRARIRLVDEPDAKKLDAEIVAFLADAAPPEHPVIALVRSFVGKPGDRGPVWSAFDRLQTQVEEGDWSGATAALGDLADALNTRLGQMHDALGRDTTEDRTL